MKKLSFYMAAFFLFLDVFFAKQMISKNNCCDSKTAISI